MTWAGEEGGVLGEGFPRQREALGLTCPHKLWVVFREGSGDSVRYHLGLWSGKGSQKESNLFLLEPSLKMQ